MTRLDKHDIVPEMEELMAACHITFDAETVKQFDLQLPDGPVPAGLVFESDFHNPIDEMLVVRHGTLTFMIGHGFMFIPATRTIHAKLDRTDYELVFECGTLLRAKKCTCCPTVQ